MNCLAKCHSRGIFCAFSNLTGTTYHFLASSRLPKRTPLVISSKSYSGENGDNRVRQLLESVNQCDGTVGLDFDHIDNRTKYNILCASILPRPVAFVSSCSSDRNIANLALFSFFMPVTSDPPTLAFSVTRKRNDEKKDTLVNIESTKHFVVNHLSYGLFKKAYQASEELPAEVDEFKAVGLTPIPSHYGPAPCVQESPLSLECKLYDLFQIGNGRYGSSTIIVGQVVYAHFRGMSFKDGKVDTDTLDSVSRLAAMNYGSADIRFTLRNDDVWSEKYW